MDYALEMYHCKKCGEWPITVLVGLPEKKVIKGKKECPCCGSTELTFEKVYAADSEGRVTE
jgi:hypothetical protein